MIFSPEAQANSDDCQVDDDDNEDDDGDQESFVWANIELFMLVLVSIYWDRSFNSKGEHRLSIWTCQFTFFFCTAGMFVQKQPTSLSPIVQITHLYKKMNFEYLGYLLLSENIHQKKSELFIVLLCSRNTRSD